MAAPNGTASRFTAQNQSTEQRLSTNVVGLVELSDFRKRKAEVLEQQEREAREAAQKGNATPTDGAAGDEASGKESGDGTDKADGADGEPTKKKKKAKDGKKKSKGKVNKLSFLGDDDDDDDEEDAAKQAAKHTKEAKEAKEKKSSVPAIKSFTQQALRKQAAEREALRKEFLVLQSAVKSTEVAIPFVFYEGANIPGGVVRVKKGDYVWLMLDRSRKVGARLGEKQEGEKADASQNGAEAQNQQKNQLKPSKARMHWARINVDDLMLVRGNLIIPHHYDIYFFIINKTIGPGGARVFDYSNELPEKAAMAKLEGLSTPGGDKAASDSTSMSASGYSHLEGADDDPSLTKVVDRRWYERNKHIYPASLWQEFDPEADYTQQVRRDHGGNAFFFAPK
ncbi:xap5 domain containing protein [Ophiostoma piceae UAMH 11346]|uniref:Xap5 domain containing protein n=1 Tax=Ophiostoma piceae (strain UAMH 11346) TaxID=1262450 RepID=S3CDE0_OPHP1|nr:xap5 domain containing protein [Ophiostoma piceae UAMH 11346]